MKVGIYNRYWTTKGGGEQNAASYASILARFHEVELVGTEMFDVGELAQALGQPGIVGLPVRVIGQHPTAATEASKDYDFWLCHSYLSDDYNLAPHGIYVTMFPQEVDIPKFLVRELKISVDSQLEQDENFIDRLVLENGSKIQIKSGERNRVSFIAYGNSGRIELIEKRTNKIVEVCESSLTKTLHTITIPKGTYRLCFSPSSGESTSIHRVTIDCLRLANGKKIGPKRLKVTDNSSPTFVDSYDAILSISKYTSEWVKKRWNIPSEIHYPAVEVRRSNVNFDEKENIIISVGRFFSAEHGHSKQQLQLVEAFKVMIAQGLTGWRLVLIGGCDAANRDYAMAVKKSALGLPIDVILNADSATLNDFLRRASIYWHATGLGMNLESNPEKAEHFGIAPVEAMSTGCIPVLFGVGGTAELVEEEVSGFTFRTLNELVDKSQWITRADKEVQGKLRESAIERAERFSRSRFETEFLSIFEKIVM